MPTSQSSSENFLNVAINDIELGMFVIAVTKQKSNVEFKPGGVERGCNRGFTHSECA